MVWAFAAQTQAAQSIAAAMMPFLILTSMFFDIRDQGRQMIKTTDGG